MPTLNWIGKDKVVGHHNDVPYHVLEHQYGYSAEKGQTTEPTHSGNMIIHGDNLLALKSLMPMYEGRIKCIYIDPPYNTGNENWVYNDNVNDPHIKKWLGEVVGREGEDLSRHDKWLCMMYPRLVLMKKLLSEDGAIFISIGDAEDAQLRKICDEIFGVTCFVANIAWQKTYSPRNDKKGLPTKRNIYTCMVRTQTGHHTSSNAPRKWILNTRIQTMTLLLGLVTTLVPLTQELTKRWFMPYNIHLLGSYYIRISPHVGVTNKQIC